MRSYVLIRVYGCTACTRMDSGFRRNDGQVVRATLAIALTLLPLLIGFLPFILTITYPLEQQD